MIHTAIVAGILGFAQGFLAIPILFGLTEALAQIAARSNGKESRAVLVIGRLCAFVVLIALYFGVGAIWLNVLLKTDDPTGAVFKAWLGASLAGFIVWVALLQLTSRAK